LLFHFPARIDIVHAGIKQHIKDTDWKNIVSNLFLEKLRPQNFERGKLKIEGSGRNPAKYHAKFLKNDILPF